MDLSALDLPLRSERKKTSLFGLPPPVSSVNVTYETAEAELAPLDRDEDETGVRAPMVPPFGRRMSTPHIRQATPEGAGRMRRNASSTSVATNASLGTPTKDVSSGRNRSRSNASIASEECHGFIASLKEPKYNKPLSPDEIAWLFQDFYAKLRHDLLGSDFELRSAEELDARRQLERETDGILDRVEKLVAGGELYQKLFALAGSHDTQLNSRIAAFRAFDELNADLREKLDLGALAQVDFQPVHAYLNRLSKESSPKAKVSVLVKAHHALVEVLERERDADADALIPVFIFALVQSEADNWWQNFLFIKRFRRASELTGHAAYCLTNLEAAIMFVERYTYEQLTPDSSAELAQFSRPIENPREPRSRSRSSSQSSKTQANFGPLGARIGETLSSYRSMLASARRPSQSLAVPLVEQRFLQTEADMLTLADVRVLLREYKRLAEFVERTRH